MLMRVSVGIHKEDIDAAIETYNLLSEKWFTHASPTLFNAGTNRPQLSRHVSLAAFCCCFFFKKILVYISALSACVYVYRVCAIFMYISALSAWYLSLTVGVNLLFLNSATW